MQLDSLGDGPFAYKLAVDSREKVQIVSTKWRTLNLNYFRVLSSSNVTWCSQTISFSLDEWNRKIMQYVLLAKFVAKQQLKI